jgi:predicted metal-binding membrane protein
MRCRNASVCSPASPAVRTAWQHGLRLGADCSLCCAGFMVALIVADAMRVIYMAAVTGVITTERLANNPERMARVIGAGIIGCSLVVIVQAV